MKSKLAQLTPGFFAHTTDCQKSDWRSHKSTCSSQSGPSTQGNSGKQPPARADQVIHAYESMALMRALTRDPGFNHTDPKQSAQQIWFTYDFMRNTWSTYWRKLLPGRVFKEIWLSEGLEANGGDEEKAKAAWPDAHWDFPGSDDENWPEKFDQECYTDCFTRDLTIRSFITDARRHALIGGPYQFTDEVLRLAKLPES